MNIDLEDIESRINEGIYGDDRMTDTGRDDAFAALAVLLDEVERLRADEARRLQLLDDAGGMENEAGVLVAEVERLRANHDGLVTTMMEREEFLCAAVEEESRGRCDDRNAVVKYLRVCGHHEAADAISLCGHPLYLCLPAVYVGEESAPNKNIDWDDIKAYLQATPTEETTK
jgi:hypothetical protein